MLIGPEDLMLCIRSYINLCAIALILGEIGVKTQRSIESAITSKSGFNIDALYKKILYKEQSSCFHSMNKYRNPLYSQHHKLPSYIRWISINYKYMLIRLEISIRITMFSILLTSIIFRDCPRNTESLVAYLHVPIHVSTAINEIYAKIQRVKIRKHHPRLVDAPEFKPRRHTSSIASARSVNRSITDRLCEAIV